MWGGIDPGGGIFFFFGQTRRKPAPPARRPARGEMRGGAGKRIWSCEVRGRVKGWRRGPKSKDLKRKKKKRKKNMKQNQSKSI